MAAISSHSGAHERAITNVVRGMSTSDGAGVRLTRVIGTPQLPRLDPFLMLDEFRSDEPQDYLAGFPDHPHRGFETVTYMIAGRFRHRDNKGNEGVLQAGSAQWMTAGRGIVHSEMPEQEEGLVHGFQLWLNLPRRDKMIEPAWSDVRPVAVPAGDGAVVNVLAGSFGGVSGPIAAGRATAPIYLDVALETDKAALVPLPFGHDGFVYPYDGAVIAGETPLPRGALGVLGAGSSIGLRAKDGPARVLVVAGIPLREPVAQLGPFVMTTRSELEEAVRDYRSGRF